MRLNMKELDINSLLTIRDTADKIIHQRRENMADEYMMNILAAIDEARDNGYNVYLNGTLAIDENCVEVIHSDDDDY